MKHDVHSCVARVPIFRVLPPGEMERLGAAMEHRHFRKNAIVLSHGTVLDYLVVVAAGRLNIVHTSAIGREQVVRCHLGLGILLEN